MVQISMSYAKGDYTIICTSFVKINENPFHVIVEFRTYNPSQNI